MTAPIAVRVLRHKCPHCPKTYNRPGRTREHMARCWFNPAARGCKTCKHFDQDPGDPDVGLLGGEYCKAGVSLAGQPAYEFCEAHADPDNPFGRDGADDCHDCRTDGKAVPPGPIVHCEKWEAAG